MIDWTKPIRSTKTHEQLKVLHVHKDNSAAILWAESDCIGVHRSEDPIIENIPEQTWTPTCFLRWEYISSSSIPALFQRWDSSEGKKQWRAVPNFTGKDLD